MSNGARMILLQGIAAAKEKKKDEARFYLEWVLRTDATSEQLVEAWRWLAEISDDPDQKREFLHKLLAYSPTDADARRKLALLEGRLKPDEIVDPDRLPSPIPQPPQPATTRRFTCPQCGGRMHFTPDGHSLKCSFCGHRQTLAEALAGEVDEQDFIVTLATAGGHRPPVATRSFQCQTCSASYVLAPEMLSLTCAFCDSVYVVELVETRELIPPEALLPFTITRDDAAQALHRWLETEGMDRRVQSTAPAGLYIPAWTFDVSGTLQWRGFRYDSSRGLEQASGSLAILHDDVLVPGSGKLRPPLLEVIDEFDLDRLVPYDPRYLADWPAEIYSIPLANASLRARERVLDREKARFPWSDVSDLTFSTAGMSVVSYKLILLPVWIAHLHDGEKRYDVAVNGQTGRVRGEKPGRGLWKWLVSLFDDT